MNESYGIEFKAITEKFKEKMRSLSNDIRNFGREAEENTKISPSIDTGYQKQIEYIKDQMDAITDQINAVKFGGKRGNLSGLEAEYEKLSNRLQDLVDKQKEFNGEVEETSKKSKNLNLGKLFDNSIAKIKRFTFYLLSARSVFSLFMKYQSIYYQYNEQLQYQSELSQNAIALSLAPAFEFLGNVIAYASIAFAKFIELLTGVNILTKVSTKGIRDYNKGLKESQTLLSGIDEITNLTMPSGTGLASQYQALDEFKKKIKEVEDWISKNEWIQKLINGLKVVWQFITEKIAPAIVNAFDYIVTNWDKLKYLFIGIGATALLFKIGFSLTGLATALGTAGAIGTLGTAGTGLLGISGALSYLAQLGAISIGIAFVVTEGVKLYELIVELQEVKKQEAEIHDVRKRQAKENVQLIEDYVGKLKNTDKNTQDWEKSQNIVNSLLDSALLSIENGNDLYEEYIPTIKDIGKELKDITGEDYTAKINLALEKGEAEKQANSFFGRLGNSLKTTWNNFLIKASNFLGGNTQIIGRFGLYANGLDYVPYDNYPALLHKGEAVVPSKYNPTIHGMGNDYTNSLLETMILKLDDLSRRPNEFIVDGKKFASATYEYYQDEDSRQNYLKGVVAK